MTNYNFLFETGEIHIIPANDKQHAINELFDLVGDNYEDYFDMASSISAIEWVDSETTPPTRYYEDRMTGIITRSYSPEIIPTYQIINEYIGKEDEV